MCPQAASFPRFLFIVYVCSRAMHSGNVAAIHERRGVKLHKVQVQATLCNQGRLAQITASQRTRKPFNLTVVDPK